MDVNRDVFVHNKINHWIRHRREVLLNVLSLMDSDVEIIDNGYTVNEALDSLEKVVRVRELLNKSNI